MPRAKENKLYRTFVKGLITEAGYLTYPEDASSDELNTILSRKGNRTRRLGIDFEDGYQLLDIELDDEAVINEFVWRSVNNNSGLSFATIQLGSLLHFYSLEEAPVSDSHKSFTVDLLTHKIPSASIGDVESNYAQFSAGRGLLFVTHPYVEPLLLEYDDQTDTISTTPLIIQIRDFEGVYDGLANDQEPTTLSKEHHYNLANQGWMSPGTSGVALPGTSNPGYIDPTTGIVREYPMPGRGELEPQEEF